jgi:hypothetical protein
MLSILPLFFACLPLPVPGTVGVPSTPTPSTEEAADGSVTLGGNIEWMELGEASLTVLGDGSEVLVVGLESDRSTLAVVVAFAEPLAEQTYPVGPVSDTATYGVTLTYAGLIGGTVSAWTSDVTDPLLDQGTLTVTQLDHGTNRVGFTFEADLVDQADGALPVATVVADFPDLPFTRNEQGL